MLAYYKNRVGSSISWRPQIRSLCYCTFRRSMSPWYRAVSRIESKCECTAGYVSLAQTTSVLRKADPHPTVH